MSFLRISIICRLTLKASSGIRGFLGLVESVGHTTVFFKKEDPAVGHVEQQVLFEGASYRNGDWYYIAEKDTIEVTRKIWGVVSDLESQGWNIKEYVNELRLGNYSISAREYNSDSESWLSRDAGDWERVIESRVLTRVQ